MRRLDAEVKKIEVDSEPEVSLPGSSTMELHRCTAPDCGKDFKLAALLARHFRSTHNDLNEDKDSWRDYHEKVHSVKGQR